MRPAPALLAVLSACGAALAPPAGGPVPPGITAAATLPASSGGTGYACSDGTAIRADYPDEDAPGGSAPLVLRLPGQSLRMIRAGAATGERWIGEGYEWRREGLTATLAPLGPEGTRGSAIACRAAP